jgi:hypothetical protein
MASARRPPAGVLLTDTTFKLQVIAADCAGTQALVPGEVKLGALPCGDGANDVCVWGPSAGSVTVPLRRGDDAARTRRRVLARQCSPRGLRVRRRRDGAARPVLAPATDRCRRAVARARHGRVRVDGADWPGLTLDELVIYELHVGTFSEEGRSPRRAAPRRAPRARRHRDRAHARRDVPRRARLGLRRRSTHTPRTRRTAGRRSSRASSMQRTPPDSA